MAKVRIGLDIDGVIADFGTHFLNYLDIEDKTPARCWDDERFTKNFHKIVDDERFWLTIPPIIPSKPKSSLKKPLIIPLSPSNKIIEAATKSK